MTRYLRVSPPIASVTYEFSSSFYLVILCLFVLARNILGQMRCPCVSVSFHLAPYVAKMGKSCRSLPICGRQSFFGIAQQAGIRKQDRLSWPSKTSLHTGQSGILSATYPIPVDDVSYRYIK